MVEEGHVAKKEIQGTDSGFLGRVRCFVVRLSEIVVYGLVLLLVLGVSQPASARSVPLLSPPTAQSEQADQPEAPAGLPARAQQVISSSLADPNPQIRANAAEVVAATRSLRLMPQVHKLLADEVVPPGR